MLFNEYINNKFDPQNIETNVNDFISFDQNDVKTLIQIVQSPKMS